MATVRDLIAASLRSIGVLASGEVPTASEASDALVVLNERVETWSLESLFVYTSGAVLVSAFASLDTVVALLPGTTLALRTSLAVDLCHEYGRPIPPELAALALEATARLKRAQVAAPGHTVLDLVRSALRQSGAIGRTDQPTTAEAADGLLVLNALLESWCLESLLVYNTTQNVFSLVAGTQSYTIGTGGVFNVERPQSIAQAALRDTSVTPNLDLALRVLTQAEWADISVKGLTATWPQWVYLDLAYPLGHVLVWPVPTAAQSLVLWLDTPLSSVASLATTLSLPKGYERALRCGLSLELATEYGRAVPEAVAAQASLAKEVIKRANSVTPLLACDAGVRQGRGASSATGLRAGGY